VKPGTANGSHEIKVGLAATAAVAGMLAQNNAGAVTVVHDEDRC